MALGSGGKLDPKVAAWPLPIRGHWAGINDAAIPDNALFSSSNVTIRSGLLQERPGLTELESQVLGSRPTGAIHLLTTAQVSKMLIGTLSTVWKYDFTTLTDLSATPGGDADNPMRMTKLVFGTPLVTNIYLCNNKSGFGLKTWKSDDASLTTISGAPVFKDITMIDDRIIGLVGAYAAQWGEPLEHTNWPAENVKSIAETDSETVSIRKFGVLGGVVYKRDSIWLFDATGQTGGEAFCFRHVVDAPGPGGPTAIASTDLGDLYMTQDGRIGFFNGATHQWVVDGLWSTVKAEIDQTFPGRIVSWVDDQNDEVWFTYPRNGDSGENLGLVIVKVRRPEVGYNTYAAFHGVLGKSVTAGLRVNKADVVTPIVFTSTTSAEKAMTVEGDSDDSTNFNWSFQTGLKPINQAEVTRLLYAEPFLERNAAYGSLTLKMSTSNILDIAGGSLSSGVTVDLTATPIRDIEGFDVRSRFMGVQFSGTSAASVRYLGTILRGMEIN